MNISEVIARLEEIRAEHGELKVLCEVECTVGEFQDIDITETDLCRSIRVGRWKGYDENVYCIISS